MAKVCVYEIATGRAVSWATSSKVADPLPPGLAVKPVSGFLEDGEVWNESTLKIERAPAEPVSPDETRKRALMDKAGDLDSTEQSDALKLILRRLT